MYRGLVMVVYEFAEKPTGACLSILRVFNSLKLISHKILFGLCKKLDKSYTEHNMKPVMVECYLELIVHRHPQWT